ncbi:hypothetical protein SNE40_009738 [Patella caerulea]|uniref:Uncharacterized protein n=1 Tax=Patella caerulea TaxID=87958 RepID=A0AAN8PS48_PATCE
MITVEQQCLSCDSNSSWSSQPKEGTVADGNISLSAAILFAGALPQKAVRDLDFWGVQIYTKDTFFIHQKKYLHGTVRNIWEKQQKENLAALDNDAAFAGDACNDSMGHCSKYGS